MRQLFRRRTARRALPSASQAPKAQDQRAARPFNAPSGDADDEWDDPDGAGESTPPRWPGFLLWAATAVFLALGLAALAGYGLVVHYSRDLPSVDSLKAGYDPPQVTRIYARDDTLLASLFSERRTVVAYDQIPDAAKLAFLAAEDARFFEHEGLNYFGIARAILANVRAGRMVQGGSTITQQVVKNVLLDATRSFARKFRELLLTRRLEQSLSKDDILWLYLNHIYLGHGRYGIEEAARYYFGKHASELMLDEAATLAGLVASPERYSPRKNPQLALKRRRFVLDQMLQKGFVVPALFEEVKERALRLSPAEETESKLVPEVVELAKKEIRRLSPKEESRGGFSVHTTIDPMLQVAARDAVRANLDAYMKRHKLLPPFSAKANALWDKPFTGGQPHRFKIYTGIVEAVDDKAGTLDVRVGPWVGVVMLSEQPRFNPTHLVPSHFAEVGAALRVSFVEVPADDEKGRLRLELGPQSALVALDARTREVVALVGNYEALAGGLDRATQMHRQPGSTFKGLLYSYGLHTRKLTPATVLPVSHAGHGVEKGGPLSLSVRDALAHSNNEAAITVLRRVGAKGFVDFSHALGITSVLKPDKSLALGSYEVTPLELANAYVAFANGGRAGEPTFLKRIVGPDGKELPRGEVAAAEPVLTPAEAYLTTSLLRGVISEGTGRAAQGLGRDAAGKTGTTNDEKDAWFVGYTTDLVAAVWVGYDDARPLGRGESGARAALPAWLQFMKAAHEGKPPTRFARPEGILAVQIDPRTGLLPAPGQDRVVTEEFLSGTEPMTFAAGDAGAP